MIVRVNVVLNRTVVVDGEQENDWRTDNLTDNRRLFNCDNRQIETHQLLITTQGPEEFRVNK